MHIHTFIWQTESLNWHVDVYVRGWNGEIFLSTTELFICTVILQVERDNLLLKLQSGKVKRFYAWQSTFARINKSVLLNSLPSLICMYLLLNEWKNERFIFHSSCFVISSVSVAFQWLIVFYISQWWT